MMPVRKILFWTHLAVGCSAGIVVLIMAVTGALLAYQRQITNWMDRDLRAGASAASSSRLPVEDILAKASAHNGAAPSAMTLRADLFAPAK